MSTPIPQHHPLRDLFCVLTERSFVETLGWPDLNVTEYVSNLLVEFAHSDNLYRIRNYSGKRLDAVVELLFESEILLEAQSLDREHDVHRHIGDFTLFMAGLFRGHVAVVWPTANPRRRKPPAGPPADTEKNEQPRPRSCR